MSGGALVTALLVGAAVLALWLHVRFPDIAPTGFRARIFAAAGAFVVVSVLPVTATMVGIVGFFLPALVLLFLSSLWLLQVAADPTSHL
jgi:hypothetical protein